jgi:hypothetical protein
VATFFSDYFDIDPDALDEYGAFNVSIINDLPLFIDPFLLFNSEKQDYRDLHDSIIQYLIFLRRKAANGPVGEDLLRLWYCFPEVRQNWLGFSMSGNSGSGLGIDFAQALHSNLHRYSRISAASRSRREVTLRRCASFVAESAETISATSRQISSTIIYAATRSNLRGNISTPRTSSKLSSIGPVSMTANPGNALNTTFPGWATITFS